MSSYSFYLSRQDITTTPKQSYIDDFEMMCDASYENAPNYFSSTSANAVQEETSYGNKIFQNITCRVDSVVDPKTGKTIGDDYKNFILLPSDDKVYVGKLFKWQSNYWLAINTNTYESVTNGCIVRRCNNVLKWINAYGVLQTEPCVIGYDLLQVRDFRTPEWNLAQGEETIYCQKNLISNEIKPNMRFLIGTKENISAWKVPGSGIKNYANNQTLDNYSPSVLEIKIEANFKNAETDDFENGIADAYINNYQIFIDQDSISQNVGFSTTLTATVYKDGSLSTDTLIKWESSDEDICSIDNDGLINLLALGNVTIKVSILNNLTVFDEKSITVTNTPIAEYDIRIIPNVYGILEGTTETMECRLYLNEVAQADSIDFTVLGNVPSYCYTFTEIDGNHFSIANHRMYLNFLNTDETVVLWEGKETSPLIYTDRQNDMVLTNSQIAETSDLIIRASVTGVMMKDFAFRLKGVY